MVRIRLSRRGKKSQPFYHIVVVDQNKKRDGAVLATVGTYNPKKDKGTEKVTLNTELYKAWLAKGAQPSETVVQIVKASTN
jgi:small subunit ribosomal protein S16